MQNKNTRPTGRGTARPSGRRAASTGSRPRAQSAQPRRSGTRAQARRKPSGAAAILMKISDLTSTGRGRLMLGGFFLVLVVLILGIGLLTGRGDSQDIVRDGTGEVVAGTATQGADELPDEGGDVEPVVEAVEPTPTAFTGTPNASAVSDKGYARPDYLAHNPETWRDGRYAPEPQADGYLPVFRSAEREDKVIAITVDDCFQTGNLKEIIQLAEDVGGKLTLFPIGTLLQRESLQELIRYAHDIGFEIENHTWDHDGLYNFDNEEFVKRIFDQDRALDLVLGVNYYTHFLRPKGGDDRNDIRTHSYINQLGYYGIAHWSATGGANLKSIVNHLKPGTVYLFHCTDKDLEKLRQFIPYAASQGYQLITLNEMFGYQKNYEEPLSDDPKTRTPLALEPYQRDYKTIKATTYDYAAYEVQAALKAQGYTKNDPDGVYGKGTAKLATDWQKDNGFKGDGVLTPEQQKKLLGLE